MHPEVERRLVHASGVILPLSYLAGVLTWNRIRLAFVLGTVFVLTLEALRLSGRIDWVIFETLTREYERTHLAGYALYMLGATAVVLAFRPAVALPATLMLMIADPVSGLLDSSRNLNTGADDGNDGDDDDDDDVIETSVMKPAHVLCSMFVICTVIAFPFVHPVPAVCGAIAATAADGAKPIIAGYVIDDNITIPPAAALAIVGGQFLVGSLPLAVGAIA